MVTLGSLTDQDLWQSVVTQATDCALTLQASLAQLDSIHVRQ